VATNKLDNLVKELRPNASSRRNKSGMVYGNKWRNTYERKASQDTDSHYGQIRILWQPGHPPAPTYRMWGWEMCMEVDPIETGTDAKNRPGANSEWVYLAASLHNVAPSGTVGVSEYCLLSRTNATWNDSKKTSLTFWNGPNWRCARGRTTGKKWATT
jgi:hypothetical protein